MTHPNLPGLRRAAEIIADKELNKQWWNAGAGKPFHEVCRDAILSEAEALEQSHPKGKTMDAFTQYRRTQIAEMRPWRDGDDLTGVSISEADYEGGSPKPGDMIARNPKNHTDQWLVAAAYFADNFELLEQSPASDDGWRGIESAPKDGRRILVWCPHGQYVVFWPDPHDHEVDWWHVTDNKNGPYPLRGGSPTHWRPLPPPPKE
jgi:hypothetical protein